MFGELLKGFEEARQRHLPLESTNPQTPTKGTIPQALSPPSTQASLRPTNNWRHQHQSVGKASAYARAAAVAAESDVATAAASQIDASADDFAQSQTDESFNFPTLEKHINHNLNVAWQNLDDYYTRTDATPIYRLAVVLHPRLKALVREALGV